MAVGFRVQIDEASRQRVAQAVEGIRNGGPIVISRALNKVSTPVVSLLVKDAAKQTGFPQKAIRKQNIRLSRANYRKLTAEIRVRGFGIPVILLKARQTRKGVTYKAGKGGRKLIPGAFIATMPSGHKGVFLRGHVTRRELREKRGKRYRTELPIKEQRTPGVPDLLVASGAFDQAKAQAANRLPAEVITQVNVLLEQHARKSRK